MINERSVSFVRLSVDMYDHVMNVEEVSLECVEESTSLEVLGCCASTRRINK